MNSLNKSVSEVAAGDFVWVGCNFHRLLSKNSDGIWATVQYRQHGDSFIENMADYINAATITHYDSTPDVGERTARVGGMV
jgi:hypothetical protein